MPAGEAERETSEGRKDVAAATVITFFTELWEKITIQSLTTPPVMTLKGGVITQTRFTHSNL